LNPPYTYSLIGSYPPARIRSNRPLCSSVTASATLPRLDEHAEHVVAARPSTFSSRAAERSVLAARKLRSGSKSPVRRNSPPARMPCSVVPIIRPQRSGAYGSLPTSNPASASASCNARRR
jgi:hypothetical protein